MLEWLEQESHTDKEDIMKGATMLLQLNRNQALYNTIARRPERFVSKIIYELKKFVPIRLAKMTMADVKQMDAEITTAVKAQIDAESAATAADDTQGTTIESSEEGEDSAADDVSAQATASGKRADHDELPADIQAIWDENADRWKKIKELFNTLLTIELPCDRYEYLVQMKELWYKYKAEFERYDNYNAAKAEEAATEDAAAESSTEDAATLAKAITNARAYISKNLDKLATLKEASIAEDADEKAIEKYNTAFNNLCDRIRILVENKQVISDELKQKLIDAGFTSFFQTETEEQAESSESTETVEDEGKED